MGPLRLVVSPGAWFKLPNRSLESCATNSTITNGLPSSRFCRTNRAVPACERPSCSEWHLLGSTIWGTVARPAGQPWSVYHLLQSLRSLATSRLGERIASSALCMSFLLRHTSAATGCQVLAVSVQMAVYSVALTEIRYSIQRL